jgi:SM-20-related protein
LQNLESIAEALVVDGWCVTPEFIPSALVRELGNEVLALARDGRLQQASVAVGDKRRLDPAVRGDRTLWLDPHAATHAQSECLAALEFLRLTLNRELQLGLFDLECHFAVYPRGGFYRKHRDQRTGTGGRAVSCVLYLNDAWQTEDGGQLRLYLDAASDAHYKDVLPAGGTLVCFMSERFWHEVLPAKRMRLSLTGWFRRRSSPH